jgi:hypothetical protein
MRPTFEGIARGTRQEMLRSVLLLLVLPTVFNEGCTNTECTLVGCADSLRVGFSGAIAEPGRYQIEVVADGTPSSCEITLPYVCGARPICSAGPSTWRLSLGCAPGQPQQSVDGFVFYQNPPTSLDFVVRRNDAVVGGGSAQPVYAESRPNGPDCDPVCRTAADIHIEIAP